MHLRKDTERIQNVLGDYCKSGIEQEIPGLTPGRVHHYRRLVYNVVRDTLDTSFPISLAALGEEQWDQLVHEFFSLGTPKEPQVWKLPYEFFVYHAHRETGNRIGKPYLDDLLYFEWMEIEVHTMPDRVFPEHVSHGDIFSDRLAFNPEYELVRMEYPIHMHPVAKALQLKGDYFALIFRVPETGHVQFMDLTGLHTYILTSLVEEQVPLNHLKGEIAGVAGIESGKYLDEALENFIHVLMEKQMILGYIKE
jgi:hypothetical protein